MPFLRVAPFSGYVQKDFADQADVWLTCDFTFEGTGAGFDNNYGYIIDANLGALSWVETCGVWWNGFNHKWQDDNDSGEQNALPTPTAVGTWHTMELHIVSGTTVDCLIDGSSVLSGSEFYGDPINKARFGADRDNGDVIYIDNIKIGTTQGGAEIFSEDFEGVDPLSNFDFADGDLSVVAAIDPPPVTPITGPPTFQWRFAVTKLNGRILAWLDGIATQRQVNYTLNKPAVATGVVPSDNPTANIVQSDGFPILEEGVRCLLGFRRESDDDPRWICRFAGIVEQLEDNVDENGGVAPYSTYTAYDPRQLLYNRPVRTAAGALPGASGVTFTGQTGDAIVQALLDRTLAADGDHYIGDFSAETTDVMPPTNFQRGMSVGEAFDQIVATGNCDIIFRALYDPFGFPGSLASVSVYKLAGYTGGATGTPNIKYKAPLAWDKPRRNLVLANRLKDGTQRANKIQYYSDVGRTAVGQVSDFAASAEYGEYWAQQFFPGSTAGEVALLAETQLTLRARGVRTYKVNPIPGSLGQVNSPLLFLDYELGTLLPIYASNRLRKKIAVAKRVISIPVVIRDDGVETISQLEFGEGEEEVTGGGGGGGEGGGGEGGGGEGGGGQPGGGDYPSYINPSVAASRLDFATSLSANAKNNSVFITDFPDTYPSVDTAMFKSVYKKNHVCVPVAQGDFGVSFEDASANGWLLKNSVGANLVWHPGGQDWYLADLSNPGYQAAWALNVYNTLVSLGINTLYNDGNTKDYHDDTGAQDAYTASAAFISPATWASNYVIPFWRYVGEYLRSRGMFIAANSALPADNHASLTKAWWSSLVFDPAGSYRPGQGVFNWYFTEYWMRVLWPAAGSPFVRLDDASNFFWNWGDWRTLPDTCHAIGSGFIGFDWGDGTSGSLSGDGAYDAARQANDAAACTYERASLLLTFDPQYYDCQILSTLTADQWTIDSHSVNIGLPIASAVQQANGTWTRAFTLGQVIVNPTLSTQTTFGHTLTTGTAYIGA